MLGRRDLLRFGLSGGAAFFGSRRACARSRFAAGDPPPSPRTTPFVQPLPFPPALTPVDPFRADCPLPPQSDLSRLRFYHMIQEERLVALHPELPLTRVWGYRDANVKRGDYPLVAGPTFIGRSKEPIVVRQENRLPEEHVGFGLPTTTVHFHGGHVPAISDGFPEDIPGFRVAIEPGHTFDYCYPLLDPGFSTGEADATDRPATMWYHDHILDFTGPNVYLGLAGFFLYFDELDSGSERSGLRLPSGEFDVPLLFQDRRLDRRGQLVYDGLIDHSGFLGDKWLTNGVIQPFLNVKRRKYRFRLLNGCNARFLGMQLVTQDGRPQPFTLIATEGGLMASPVRGRDLAFLSPAQREDIVVDFSRYREGTVLYLEDRVDQEDGRGPKGDFEEPELLGSGRRFLKIIVGPEADDPSQVPDELRPFEAISAAEIARARRREFVFDRRHGVWAVNGEPVDLERSVASPGLNEPEVWHLVNKSGGWWHPVHVHLEFMHILRRNGRRAVDDLERDGQSKRDVITLGPNDDVEAFFKFRDFPGPWVFHCHTLEHEDAFMMARFTVGPS
jgi:FtsP/CotA-like multicopper oxidase with cupredoxin domain